MSASVFTIWARVLADEGGFFTAVVSAVPVHTNTLAEVRSLACDSRQDALTMLDPMARVLGTELMSRGDLVASVEFP